MANEEHLAILKRGVKAWNAWRQKNPGIRPDLCGAVLRGTALRRADLYLCRAVLNEADLSDTGLRGANLSGADLHEADLRDADLRAVDLHEANLGAAVLCGAVLFRADLTAASLTAARLTAADLTGVSLRGARLTAADLFRAKLLEANLSGAYLTGADLTAADLTGVSLRGARLTAADLFRAKLLEANLSGAYLTGADLTGADLTGADLREADLTRVVVARTVFAEVDLSATKGLETVKHDRPSSVGIDTLFRSGGKTPEVFLRGCGVPETLIANLPALLENPKFFSCFISYSHADREFARLLYKRLQDERIRCWLDEYERNPGGPPDRTMVDAIRHYDKLRLYGKLVFCCSQTALKSWWVEMALISWWGEKEFTRGVKKEEDYRLSLIIPVDLDGYLFDEVCTGRVADYFKQRKVEDCTGWKDHDQFEAAARRIMNALRTDSGHPPPPEPKLRKARSR